MEIYINLYFLHFESRMPQAECFRLRRRNYIIFVCCEAATLLPVFKILLPIFYFAQARIELLLRAFCGRSLAASGRLISFSKNVT